MNQRKKMPWFVPLHVLSLRRSHNPDGASLAQAQSETQEKLISDVT